MHFQKHCEAHGAQIDNIQLFMHFQKHCEAHGAHAILHPTFHAFAQTL
jgi:hypothetical protein